LDIYAEGDNALVVSGATVYHTVGHLSGHSSLKAYDNSAGGILISQTSGGYMYYRGENSHYVAEQDVAPIRCVGVQYFPLAGNPDYGHPFCISADGMDDKVAVADQVIGGADLCIYAPDDKYHSGQFLNPRWRFTPQCWSDGEAGHRFDKIKYSAVLESSVLHSARRASSACSLDNKYTIGSGAHISGACLDYELTVHYTKTTVSYELCDGNPGIYDVITTTEVDDRYTVTHNDCGASGGEVTDTVTGTALAPDNAKTARLNNCEKHREWRLVLLKTTTDAADARELLCCQPTVQDVMGLETWAYTGAQVGEVWDHHGVMYHYNGDCENLEHIPIDDHIAPAYTLEATFIGPGASGEYCSSGGCVWELRLADEAVCVPAGATAATIDFQEVEPEVECDSGGVVQLVENYTATAKMVAVGEANTPDYDTTSGGEVVQLIGDPGDVVYSVELGWIQDGTEPPEGADPDYIPPKKAEIRATLAPPEDVFDFSCGEVTSSGGEIAGLKLYCSRDVIAEVPAGAPPCTPPTTTTYILDATLTAHKRDFDTGKDPYTSSYNFREETNYKNVSSAFIGSGDVNKVAVLTNRESLYPSLFNGQSLRFNGGVNGQYIFQHGYNNVKGNDLNYEHFAEYVDSDTYDRKTGQERQSGEDSRAYNTTINDSRFTSILTNGALTLPGNWVLHDTGDYAANIRASCRTFPVSSQTTAWGAGASVCVAINADLTQPAYRSLITYTTKELVFEELNGNIISNKYATDTGVEPENIPMRFDHRVWHNLNFYLRSGADLYSRACFPTYSAVENVTLPALQYTLDGGVTVQGGSARLPNMQLSWPTTGGFDAVYYGRLNGGTSTTVSGGVYKLYCETGGTLTTWDQQGHATTTPIDGVSYTDTYRLEDSETILLAVEEAKLVYQNFSNALVAKTTDADQRYVTYLATVDSLKAKKTTPNASGVAGAYFDYRLNEDKRESHYTVKLGE
jgi:hypothetical protein